jgi:hypothetical protein
MLCEKSDILMVVTLAARNEKSLWWDVVESVFGWSMESGGWFYGGTFGRNLASVAIRFLSHLTYFIKNFYKCCTFSVICKGNTATSCITVQDKKG